MDYCKEKLRIIICITLSLIFSIILAEIFLRVLFKYHKNYDMEMLRLSIYGKVYLNREDLSHVSKKNAYFKNLYGVEVKINSKGLRDYEYSYEKPPGTYRILVLGNSITFGWGVKFNDIYSKLLEKKLNETSKGVKYEVINTGVCNYQLQQELTFLKKEGLKYNPDLIIYGYFVNDARIIPKVPYAFLLRKFYFFSYLKSKIIAIKSNFNKKTKFDNFYKAFYEDGTLEKTKFDNNVSELKRFTKEKNISLVVVLIPDMHYLRDYPFENINNYVKEKFAEVKAIDLLPYFDKQRDPKEYWVSFEDPHHNALAHKIIADVIYQELNLQSK